MRRKQASPVVTRPARPEDAALLAELGASTFVETFERANTPENFAAYMAVAFGEAVQREELEDPGTTVFFAERDADVVGYTTSSRFRQKQAYETTVEMTIVCAPDAVGIGVGSRLYATIFPLLGSEDIHMAVAGITLPNEASCALHERFGFERVGVEPEVGRKFGRYWDVAWYMRRIR